MASAAEKALQTIKHEGLRNYHTMAIEWCDRHPDQPRSIISRGAKGFAQWVTYFDSRWRARPWALKRCLSDPGATMTVPCELPEQLDPQYRAPVSFTRIPPLPDASTLALGLPRPTPGIAAKVKIPTGTPLHEAMTTRALDPAADPREWRVDQDGVLWVALGWVPQGLERGRAQRK